MTKFKEHPEAPSFDLCVGKNCKGASLDPIEPFVPPKFAWTSPSYIPKRSAQQRRDHHCIYDKKKKKFTGNVCLDFDKKTKECLQEAPDAFCKTTTPPCSSERRGCPVQLIYIKGKPNLRFCKKQNEPGYLVPVKDPEKAQKLAEKACSNFAWWSSNYFEKNAPQILQKAQKAHPKPPRGTPGMGEAVPVNPLLPIAGILGGIIAGLTLFRHK